MSSAIRMRTIVAAALLVLTTALHADSVTGTLTSLNGQKLAGVTVYSIRTAMCDPQAAILEERSITDANGHYQIDNLPVLEEATVRLAVACQPGKWLGWTLWDIGNQESSGCYTITQKLRVQRLKSFSGRVTALGKPVRNTTVRLENIWLDKLNSYCLASAVLEAVGMSASAKTDSRGRFSVEMIPAGAKASVDVTLDGYAIAQSAIADGGTVNLVKEGSLLVTIKRWDGKPAEGVKITVNPYSSDLLRIITTDKNGRADIRRLSPGPVYLAADYAGGCVIIGKTPVAVSGKQTKVSWKAVPFVMLKGRVVDDATGEGVQGIQITARPYNITDGASYRQDEAVSSSSGEFQLRVTAGQISVWCNNYPQGTLPTEKYLAVKVPPAGLNDVEFRLVKSAILTGTVVDPTGKPLSGMEVTCYELFSESLKTDSEGRFKFTKPVDGGNSISETLTIEARHPSLPYAGQITLRYQDLAKGGPRIVASKTKPIQVTVKNAKGQAIKGARVDRVFFRNNNESSDYGDLTDAKGRAKVKSIARTDAKIGFVAYAKGYYPQRPPKKWSFDALPEQVTITVNPATRIMRGRVIDIEGRPVSGANVKLSAGGDNASPSAKTNARGEFILRNLPPGDTYLEISKGKQSTSRYLKSPRPFIVLQLT